MANKIAIFYHVYQYGDYWKELFVKQMTRLQQSGLYDAADYIHIGVNGSYRIPSNLLKIDVIKTNKNIDSEKDTLVDLWNFCKENPEYRVFYFHIKGVRVYKMPKDAYSVDDQGRPAKDDDAWRDYMEEINIDSWREISQKLDTHDCAGTEFHKFAALGGKTMKYPHYSGNFWWANASYIKQLDVNFLHQEIEISRWLPEFWIGTRNPKAYSYHTCPNYAKYLRRFEEMKSKIAIFYHLYQTGNWEEVFTNQMIRLQQSGLYDAADYIHIGVSGSHQMPFNLNKVEENGTLKRNNDISSEIETLIDLAEFCKENPDYKVIFLHAKGVTWHNTQYEYPTKCWREYLEYFVIDNWRICLEKCEMHDVVGTEFYHTAIQNDIVVEDKPHYAGNFWWANANYFASLDKNYLYDAPHGRFNCEFWIGTKFPNAFNFMSRDKNWYEYPVNPNEYNKYFENTVEKKKCKIGMISMFKNESKNIGKMLDSLSAHIDYWVLQDNGSTDGTPEIVNAWAEKTKIPGYMYKVDEGWIGFGWNRDHVLQKFLSSEHNCDWILKMDCDETLEVDEDFDWKILNDNKNVVSWNVQSEAPGTVYLRTWLWNSHLPWKFNHDPAHETIYLDDGKNNTEFERMTLPGSFRLMAGASLGESYTVPTKYISDALKLEEKLIREGNLLSNLYHFWYLGKSYSDCYGSSALPLGKSQQREYAKRCIYYLTEYLNHTHDFQNTGRAKHIDEMSYVGLCCIGHAYRFLEQYDESEKAYIDADSFSPGRNEHLVHLAELHLYKMEYKKALYYTTILMNPERKCPFPNYCFLISTQCYNDKGNYCQELHDVALEWSAK